jgi:hypothetical protein
MGGRVGAFVDAQDHALLVDPDRGGDVDQIVGRADRVLRVDQGHIGGLGFVVPLSRCRLAGRVLGGGDDDEVLVADVFVNSLPT